MNDLKKMDLDDFFDILDRNHIEEVRSRTRLVQKLPNTQTIKKSKKSIHCSLLFNPITMIRDIDKENV